MKPQKPKLIALDIVYSNRLRFEIEEKFAQVTNANLLKDLVKLLLLCDNFIDGNEVRKHPTIKKNVGLVKNIRRKTLAFYNAKKPNGG